MSLELKKKAVIQLRFLYPVWAIVGMLGILYVPSKLIVHGDAITTVQNIQTNEFLFRTGIVSSLITQLLFIIVVLLLYRLFKDVNTDQAILMVVFALVSVPISMLNSLNRVAALFQLNHPDQAMLYLDLNEQGIIIASIFWGLWLFPLGYLIARSGYFPKFIGYAVIVGGVGYTIGSFTRLLNPDLHTVLTICEFMTFGEIVWLLWLIIRGAKWPQE